jgi:hypothetical protein
MSDKHVERMVCVRKRFPYVCAFAVMFFSAFVLVSPIMVKGEVYDIPPGQILYYKVDGENGGEISWDWHCTNLNYGVDFWIEDSSGTRYSYQQNVASWQGSFKLPYSDTWYVKFYNKYWVTTVTIEATIKYAPPIPPSPPPSNQNIFQNLLIWIEFSWIWIVIGIASVVIVITVALIAIEKPKSHGATFVCNVCGCSLRLIPEYNRWYCDNCKKYL